MVITMVKNEMIKDLNTESRADGAWPVLYGLACNVKNGDVFPAEFPSKGPEFSLRSCRHFGGETEVRVCFGGVFGCFSWFKSLIPQGLE